MKMPETVPHTEVPHAAAELIERLRKRRPRIHCITNAVAQNFTANVLLAMDCVPSMTHSPDEVGAFVARSEGLLVNLGTFDAERRTATALAIETALQNGVPWVLDPVFVDRSPARAAFARELVARRPMAIRLNQLELAAMAGGGAEGEVAKAYARANNVVVALSGGVDHVTDGERVAVVANGHPMMAKVTAMGCAASALVAACLAVESDPWRASTAALLMLGVAGEIAGNTARGPGSLGIGVIDALNALDAAALVANARVG